MSAVADQRAAYLRSVLHRAPVPSDAEKISLRVRAREYDRLLKMPTGTVVVLWCCECGWKTYLGCVLKHRYCRGCGKGAEHMDENGEVWFAKDEDNGQMPATGNRSSPSQAEYRPRQPSEHDGSDKHHRRVSGALSKESGVVYDGQHHQVTSGGKRKSSGGKRKSKRAARREIEDKLFEG